MEITQEQLQFLRDLKNTVDSDNIRYKEIIKKSLIENDYVLYLLNNKELEDAEADPSDYLGVNILPYYIIHPIQHNIQNYICFEVGFHELDRGNAKFKQLQITFHVLCEQSNNIEKNTGIARHDLLGAIILDIFNWSNLFGVQIHCISDDAGVTDNNYAARTIIFRQFTDNNLAKTRNKIATMNPREITTSYGKDSDN